MFKWFNDFMNKMNRKVYRFCESKPGVLEKNNKFYLKNNSVPPLENKMVNTFCWNVRDTINTLFEKDLTEKKCPIKRKSSGLSDKSEYGNMLE